MAAASTSPHAGYREAVWRLAKFGFRLRRDTIAAASALSGRLPRMVVAGLPTFATKEPAAPSIDALQHGPIHSLWPLASPIPSMPLEHHVPLPAWDDEMPEAYAWLRERLEGAVACTEFEFHLPWIDAIRRLKVQRGAMVLAHNYQHPLVFHGVADVTGDSLALARAGREAAAEVLVLCGVGFMGETAKLLSPGKTLQRPAARWPAPSPPTTFASCASVTRAFRWSAT
jgi:hypothetical protein